MTDLRVRTLDARYRLRRPADRGRLDAALRLVLDSALDAELARLGLGNGVWCVRGLYVPVRLNPRDPLASVAEAWARAFAAELERTVRAAPARSVAWFPSRRSALVAFGSGAAVGEIGAAWAWRQALALPEPAAPWTPADAVRAWAVALAADAPAVVPVLAAMATRGRLAALAARLPDECYAELAEVAAGRPRGWLRTLDAVEVVPSAGRAARIAAGSTLLTATGTPLRVRAAALLAVAEVEPAALGAADDEVAALVGAVVAAARGGSIGATSVARPTRVEAAAAEVEPEAVSNDARPRAWTAFGGLLFLVGLAEEIGVPGRVADTERGARWFLHRLARRLVPAADDDPAALAFAGLSPTADPPFGEPTAEEAEFVAQLADELTAALAERLGPDPEVGDDPVGFVCRRAAEVVADPGWFELRFAPGGVSTAVRRAGLDRDPGYVRWLGVVLKFAFG